MTVRSLDPARPAFCFWREPNLCAQVCTLDQGRCAALLNKVAADAAQTQREENERLRAGGAYHMAAYVPCR